MPITLPSHAPAILTAFLSIAACTAAETKPQPAAEASPTAASAVTNAPSKGARDQGGDAGAEMNAQTCDDFLTRAGHGFQRALEGRKTDCQSDGDCVSVRAACWARCTPDVVIAASEKADYEHAVADLVQDCERYEQAGCRVRMLEGTVPRPQYPCSLTGPKCVAGRCEAVRMAPGEATSP